jgi:ATP-dependent RNA helicase DDX19/DBP5
VQARQAVSTNPNDYGALSNKLSRLLPPNIQIALFSATFPQQVLHFAQIFAPNANQITLKHEELTVEGIKQFFFDCDNEETKYQALVKFYGMLTVSSSIIFCKVRKLIACRSSS